ncbi:MAG: porin [Gammaproteobacteria bacterium]|nr:porin [Gammaproteobacteria bacterium]
MKSIRQSLMAVAAALACVIVAPLRAADSTPNIEFGGRLQVDTTDYDSDKYQYIEGSELRRGRLFIRGDLSENWDYKLQYDFAPDHTELKDGYIRYSGFANSRITIGHFKVYGSLEELTSSNNITFTERALPNALVSGRRTGIGFQNWSDRYSLAVAAYGHEANNAARGEGISGRFVYRPNLGIDSILHLGLAMAREDDDDDTIRRRARPESHQDSHRIISTGNIANIDDFDKVVFEAAYINGRFSAQSEFVTQNIERRLGSDLEFNGYYAYASYFLTDDSRPYSASDAAFGTVRPSSDKGAWEIAVRLSNLELNDGGIMGGEADSITLGVNYYMTRDLRFTANYIIADSDMAGVSDDPNALQLRIRFTF